MSYHVVISEECTALVQWHSFSRLIRPGDVFFLITCPLDAVEIAEGSHADFFERIVRFEFGKADAVSTEAVGTSSSFGGSDFTGLRLLIDQLIKDFAIPRKELRIHTNSEENFGDCAKLRDHYQIPGDGVEETEKYLNKGITKRCLASDPAFPSEFLPRFEAFDHRAYAKNGTEYLESVIKRVGLPAFIKPLCGSASCKVQKIENLEALVEWAADNEIAEFQIEEFLDGTLCEVSSILVNGEIERAFALEYLWPLGQALSERRNLGHLVLPDESKQAQRLLAYNAAVVQTLHPLGSCMLHHEMFITRDGRIKFVEISKRCLMGGCVPEMCTQAFGLNFRTVDYALRMGLPVNTKPTPNKWFHFGVAQIKYPNETYQSIITPLPITGECSITLHHPFNEEYYEEFMDVVEVEWVMRNRSYRAAREDFEALRNFKLVNATQKSLPAPKEDQKRNAERKEEPPVDADTGADMFGNSTTSEIPMFFGEQEGVTSSSGISGVENHGVENHNSQSAVPGEAISNQSGPLNNQPEDEKSETGKSPYPFQNLISYFQIVPFQLQHFDATVNLMTQTFRSSEPLLASLKVDADTCHDHFHALCTAALNAGLSFVAIQRSSGDVVACRLVDTHSNDRRTDVVPSDKTGDADPMGPIKALIGSLEDEALKILYTAMPESEKTRCAGLLSVAVRADCRKRGLASALNALTLYELHAQGYTHVFGVFTSYKSLRAMHKHTHPLCLVERKAAAFQHKKQFPFASVDGLVYAGVFPTLASRSDHKTQHNGARKPVSQAISCAEHVSPWRPYRIVHRSLTTLPRFGFKRPALVHGRVQFSYRKLFTDAYLLAEDWRSSLNVQGDKAVVMCSLSYSSLCVMLALTRLGCCVCPVTTSRTSNYDERSNSDERAHITQSWKLRLAKFGPQILVCERSMQGPERDAIEAWSKSAKCVFVQYDGHNNNVQQLCRQSKHQSNGESGMGTDCETRSNCELSEVPLYARSPDVHNASLVYTGALVTVSEASCAAAGGNNMLIHSYAHVLCAVRHVCAWRGLEVDPIVPGHNRMLVYESGISAQCWVTQLMPALLSRSTLVFVPDGTHDQHKGVVSGKTEAKSQGNVGDESASLADHHATHIAHYCASQRVSHVLLHNAGDMRVLLQQLKKLPAGEDLGRWMRNVCVMDEPDVLLARACAKLLDIQPTWLYGIAHMPVVGAYTCPVNGDSCKRPSSSADKTYSIRCMRPFVSVNVVPEANGSEYAKLLVRSAVSVPYRELTVEKRVEGNSVCASNGGSNAVLKHWIDSGRAGMIDRASGCVLLDKPHTSLRDAQEKPCGRQSFGNLWWWIAAGGVIVAATVGMQWLRQRKR